MTCVRSGGEAVCRVAEARDKEYNCMNLLFARIMHDVF